jgi:hypothetical protein
MIRGEQFANTAVGVPKDGSRRAVSGRGMWAHLMADAVEDMSGVAGSRSALSAAAQRQRSSHGLSLCHQPTLHGFSQALQSRWGPEPALGPRAHVIARTHSSILENTKEQGKSVAHRRDPSTSWNYAVDLRRSAGAAELIALAQVSDASLESFESRRAVSLSEALPSEPLGKT